MPDRREGSYPPLPEALPFAVYDNHTHLEPADSAAGAAVVADGLDYREQLDRAATVGICGVVQVGTDLASSIWSAETAAIEPRMLAAVAIHPNDAPDYDSRGELDDALVTIAELAERPRVRAVGETGLDFFRTGADGRDAQYRAFEAHIEIAKRNNLALQIHDRDAHAEVIATLQRVGAPERTVFHCFSGDTAMVRLCAENGWFMSFAGNITFRNAGVLREALAAVPRELLLVETDAPYLTPMPYRGRPNAPYLVPYTLRAMAEQLDEDAAMLGQQIAANTERVYGSWNADLAALAAPAGAAGAVGAVGSAGSAGSVGAVGSAGSAGSVGAVGSAGSVTT